MALSEAQKKAIEKDSGVKKAFKSGDKAAASALANIALFAIPGGGVIRVGRTGGKIAASVLKRIRSLGGTRVTKPTSGQLAKAKPISALKPLQPANRASSQGGRTAKEAGTSVTKAPGTAVKPKGTSVTSSTRSRRTKGTGVGPARPPMKNVTPKAKPTTPTPTSKIVGLSNKGKVAAGVVAGLGAAALLASGRDKGKASAATSSVSSPKSRPTKKPSLTYRGGQRKAAPKKGSYDEEKKQNKKGPGVGKQDKADPRKDFKSKPVKNAALPAGAKPFKGSYNSKTHKLQNIRGKTYVVKK